MYFFEIGQLRFFEHFFFQTMNILFHIIADIDVKVFTVASEETEGYLRYIRSANYYNVEVIFSRIFNVLQILFKTLVSRFFVRFRSRPLV